MPGRQIVNHYGLRLMARPHFWLRRWLRFPFYFQHTNPTFEIEVERVLPVTPQDDWPDEGLVIQASGADDAITERHLRGLNPNEIKVGQTIKTLLPEIFSDMCGPVVLSLLTDTSPLRIWKPLYAYEVRPEEQLWTWVFLPTTAAAVPLFFSVAGILIGKWLL